LGEFATIGGVNKTRLAAYAWCENADGVLLARIAPGFADTGWWTLPGGGLDFGEDPVDCVLRELREETGLEGRIDELVGIVSYVLEPSETILGDRLHVVGMLYRVTPTAGRLRDEPDGTTDHAEWISFGRLDDLPLVDLVAWARRTVAR
jgi:ADP-ribose pyrophosphatase YjhB (NUDIX family)